MTIKTAALFLGAVVLFYSPSFSNSFVGDDFEFLGRINLRNAGRYFGKSWGYGNEYRPILVYSYAVDDALGRRNPVEYHVVNTVLHGINALLAALIFRELGLPEEAMFWTAFIFVLNPITHESVLWIAGRPVVLSATFVLFSVWTSLRASVSKMSRSWWLASYLSFVCGLLTYEGAAVLPLLLLVAHYAHTSRPAVAHWRVHVLAFGLVIISYLLAWNLLFHFKITRFPLESSPATGLLSIGTAIHRSFHGSLRLLPATLFLVLLLPFVVDRIARRFLFIAALWFVCAYLPFLLVHGFADRFAYLSAAATAGVLGFAVFDLSSRWKLAGGLAGVALLMFFAAGMTTRMLAWEHAGELAKRIPAQIKALHPQFPPNATLILVNVPDMYRGAYVFLTGVERAVKLQYPDTPLSVLRGTSQSGAKSDFVIDCSGDRVKDVYTPRDKFIRPGA